MIVSNSDSSCGRHVIDSYDRFIWNLEQYGYRYCGEGSFRRTYVNYKSRYVVKVPVYSDGIVDNIMEAKAYRKYRNNPTDYGIYLAPCRLLPNKCLIMARCEIIRDLIAKPQWSGNVDNGQVGYYNGRVVAYDFALDLSERSRWETEENLSSNFYNSGRFTKRLALK